MTEAVIDDDDDDDDDDDRLEQCSELIILIENVYIMTSAI